MKTQNTDALNEMIRWINNVDNQMHSGMNFGHTMLEVRSVKQMISVISENIKDEYPFYADMLPQIASILFQFCGPGMQLINAAAFGELVIIIRHIEAEPVNLGIWNHIHPRIVNRSKALYCDHHFDSAAEKAVKEVETHLREKYVELKPSAAVPSKVGDIIGALMSENGGFQFCDTTDQSGKDYRRGVKLLFKGLMAAYRNPSAHANLDWCCQALCANLI